MKPEVSTTVGKIDSPSTSKLGTFGGVFTPSVLTILGIILFRRLGYIVGSAGLELALVIIFLSCAISVITSISLAAIATNMRVQGGGVYYLISRTLGVEFGGAIGIVLFIAQSVSIAFYCIGFAEVVVDRFFGGGRIAPEMIAAAAVIFLFGFAWLGADWATKFQYLVMGILGGALASFFWGGYQHWDNAVFASNFPPPELRSDFWLLFAIFFPAVTGFTQGVSMSGDLKDPGKSLVVGTFWAVGGSTLVYFAAAVTIAAAMPGQTLIRDYGAMGRVASADWAIDAGVIAATLSSAMASFLGAPRILQSIGRDRIFPFLLPFARGVGDAENPRRAVMLSGVIALGTLFLGNLNYVAAVVSMFFLISYGLLNYATFAEARAASPSFRPRFRFFNARISLVGALGCLGAMVAIDVTSSAIAFAVLFAVHQYLQRTAGPARWADSQYSYHFHRIRENLLAMAEEPEHPRGWRPCILAFCDDPVRREGLLRFASWIEGDSGLTTAVQIIEGEGASSIHRRDKTELELKAFIAEHGLKMFARSIVAPDFRVGVDTLLQSYGVGKIRANMVLLSKSDQLPVNDHSGARIRYGNEVNEAMRLGYNVVVLDAQAEEWGAIEARPGEGRRIDVWWWGGRNSHLSLLLAYLMTRHEDWRDAEIRVLAASSKQAKEKTLQSLLQTLEEVRIQATAEVVQDVDLEKVVNKSAQSSIVFFPLRYREQQLLGSLESNVERLLDQLPLVALIAAREEIDLTTGPEEGEVAEKAAAMDRVQDSDAKAAEAERHATELARAAEQKRRDLNELKALKADPREIDAARKEQQEAVQRAQDAIASAASLRSEAEREAQSGETLVSRPAEIAASGQGGPKKDHT